MCVDVCECVDGLDCWCGNKCTTYNRKKDYNNRISSNCGTFSSHAHRTPNKGVFSVVAFCYGYGHSHIAFAIHIRYGKIQLYINIIFPCSVLCDNNFCCQDVWLACCSTFTQTSCRFIISVLFSTAHIEIYSVLGVAFNDIKQNWGSVFHDIHNLHCSCDSYKTIECNAMNEWINEYDNALLWGWKNE